MQLSPRLRRHFRLFARKFLAGKYNLARILFLFLSLCSFFFLLLRFALFHRHALRSASLTDISSTSFLSFLPPRFTFVSLNSKFHFSTTFTTSISSQSTVTQLVICSNLSSCAPLLHPTSTFTSTPTLNPVILFFFNTSSSKSIPIPIPFQRQSLPYPSFTVFVTLGPRPDVRHAALLNLGTILARTEWLFLMIGSSQLDCRLDLRRHSELLQCQSCFYIHIHNFNASDDIGISSVVHVLIRRSDVLRLGAFDEHVDSPLTALRLLVDALWTFDIDGGDVGTAMTMHTLPNSALTCSPTITNTIITTSTTTLISIPSPLSLSSSSGLRRWNPIQSATAFERVQCHDDDDGNDHDHHLQKVETLCIKAYNTSSYGAPWDTLHDRYGLPWYLLNTLRDDAAAILLRHLDFQSAANDQNWKQNQNDNHKVIVLRVKHGLANRLRALASAIALANGSGVKNGVPLIVQWPIDAHCQLCSSSLFDIGDDDNSILNLENIKIPILFSFTTFNITSDEQQQQKIQFFHTSCELPGVNWMETTHILQQLSDHFNPTLKHIVAGYVTRLHKSVCIHVRHNPYAGDIPGVTASEYPDDAQVGDVFRRLSDPKLLGSMAMELLSESEKRNVFVAADNEKWVESIRKSFPGDISVWRHERNNECRSERKSKSKGGRDEVCMLDAVVDLLALAQCNVFVGSAYSSFTDVAMRMHHRNNNHGNDEYIVRMGGLDEAPGVQTFVDKALENVTEESRRRVTTIIRLHRKKQMRKREIKRKTRGAI